MQKLFIVTVALLSAYANHANAYCQMTTDSTAMISCPPTGFPLLWKKSCVGHMLSTHGLPQFLDPSAGMGWTETSLRQTLQAGYDAWNHVHCMGAPIAISGKMLDGTTDVVTSEFNLTGPNVSSVIFQTNWDALGYDHSLYAVTNPWRHKSTGEIVDVDMEINQQNYLFFDCTTRACMNDDIDLLNVLTHESGHTWGLGHSTISRATMFGTARANEISKRDLYDDDVEGICAAYPADGGLGTCDYTAIDNTPPTPHHGCTVSERQRGERQSVATFASFILLFALALRRRMRSY